MTQQSASLEAFFKSLVSSAESWNYIPTVLSMVINVFHVFILSRKTVSSSAVNCILLGMGVVDILSPVIYIKIAVNNWLEPRECKLPSSYIQVVVDWIFYAIRDDFRRCSVWLGLTLAVIRTISLKTATKKQFHFINESKTGLVSIINIVIISSIFTICYVFRYQLVHVLVPWVPEKGCPDLLPLDSLLRHPHRIEEITGSSGGRLVHLVLTAVFEKIIPSILFPIFAILLVSELRKKKKVRKMSRQHDTTNQLVVYMTITFIIIELPIGVCKLITATRATYEEASLVSLAESWNYIPTVLSMVINVFHVFILSRKTVSSSAVNCILLGMGVVDILSPVIYIKIAVNNWLEPRECKLPSSYIQVLVDWIFYAIRDNFRRCSVWLGLTLAVIRTISLKMATKNRFNFINESKTGRTAIFVIVLLSSLLSICYVFRYQIVHTMEPWSPQEEFCKNFLDPSPDRYSISEITSTDSMIEEPARKVHLVLTAIFGKIIPSILFPISAIILILELRKTKKLRLSKNKHSERTNRLVVYMTITFMVIELPIGICNLVTATRKGYEDAIIPESISKILNMIYVSVTATHFLICFLISSQYRKTVKKVLGVSGDGTARSRMFSTNSKS
ncbi:hypothetical protein CRE_23484 [Caenorhabditis remanei]|uniref:G-protein coupled receptors family 1 profile domain-containing protein n=1 Tax=Caenorhabditis remanei TaxID=31234 RepID=E3MGZ6_CAERE|nr:hypothetical protein CRE_23484 [Caenorhabditis remanei]